MKRQFHNLFFPGKNISDDRQEAHEYHHRKISWVYYCTFVAGLWLIASPSTFGYQVPTMIWNDILSGIALAGLSYLALKPYKLWAQWSIVFIGIWLLIAPMVFWAVEGSGLLTDYFTGTVVVLFGIIVPGQPGIKLYAPKGPNVPAGWSYNPAAWDQRIPVIFLAWIGFFISRYMGAFQLGYIDVVWDPFFDEGTRRVLNSEVSHSFPVSDAMLGAFAYIMDVLFGAAGGIHRWRTMPWVVIIFGILIIPLGAVSITLIVLQPLAVGCWCSLCLTTALLSLIMIPFAIDEVLATVQLMAFEKKERDTSYWTSFWFGGTMDNGETEPAKNPVTLIEYTCRGMFKDLLNIPWNLLVTVAIGAFVMLAPALLGFDGAIASSHHLTGALVLSAAVVAMSEVARPLRFVNIVFGLWIMAAPWVLSAPQAAVWEGAAVGILLILLSLPRGKIKSRRGNFDKYIV